MRPLAAKTAKVPSPGQSGDPTERTCKPRRPDQGASGFFLCSSDPTDDTVSGGASRRRQLRIGIQRMTVTPSKSPSGRPTNSAASAAPATRNGQAKPDAGSPSLGLSTVAIHGGEARHKPGDALIDPIFCTATYTFDDTDSIIRFIEEKQPREEYGRYGNPSEKVVEQKLAELDAGTAAVLFGSGMSAFAALLLAKLNAGDEVVMFDECYHRSREFATKHLGRFGVTTRQVPTGDYEAMEAAITPRTKLLVSESPTNPHLSVVDLERFVQIGEKRGVETLIDATLATPYNVRPLAAGVDYVLHSATKYLAGHNDLLAGVLVSSPEKLEDVRKLRGIMGAISSPHNIYLLQRGLKTFELRMQRHNDNGLALARFLESHPRVERVYYPGLESHPYHAVAQATMRGFGGLVTFLVKDADWRQTARVVDAFRIPRIAPSLGGVESLVEQPLVMSYYETPPEDRQRFGISDNMIRLACGIENTEDLVADAAQALEAR